MDIDGIGGTTKEGWACGISTIHLVNTAGAVLTSWWLIYLAFRASGCGYAVLGFILFGMVFRAGVAPLFAFSASVAFFGLHAVGAWLPIVAYFFAAIGLFTDQIQRNL